MSDVTKHIDRLHSANDGAVKAIFITGLSGSGKSTLATRYLYEVEKNYHTIVTLELGSLRDFYGSLVQAAIHFGFQILPSSHHSPEIHIKILSTHLCRAMKNRSNWLLLVDNCRSDSPMTEYWPQPGDTRWGVGTVLVTTTDSTMVPSNCTHSAVVDVGEGLEIKEAANLLIRMSNDNDREGAHRAVKQSSLKPYDLEVLATIHMHLKELNANWSWDRTLSQDISIEMAVVNATKSQSACGNLLFLFGLLNLSCIPQRLATTYLTLKRNESFETWGQGLNRCLLVQLQEQVMMSSNMKFWTVHRITHKFLIDLVKTEDVEEEREHLVAALGLTYRRMKEVETLSEALLFLLFKPSIEQLLSTSFYPNHRAWLLYLLADITGLTGNQTTRHELLTKSLQITEKPEHVLHVEEKVLIMLELGSSSALLGRSNESDILYRKSEHLLQTSNQNNSLVFAWLQLYYAKLLKDRGKYGSALKRLSLARDVLSSNYSTVSPTAEWQVERERCVVIKYVLGKDGLEKSIQCLEKLLAEIRNKTRDTGKFGSTLASTSLSLGRHYYLKDDPTSEDIQRGISLVTSAKSHYERMYGNGSVLVADTLTALARIHIEANCYSIAQEQLDEAGRMFTGHDYQDTVYYGYWTFNTALYYLHKALQDVNETGRLDIVMGSRHLFKQSYDIFYGYRGSDDMDTLLSLRGIARTYFLEASQYGLESSRRCRAASRARTAARLARRPRSQLAWDPPFFWLSCGALTKEANQIKRMTCEH